MTATILVVDDLDPNVRLLEAKLLSEYYTVFTANSGRAALEVLKNEKIDVILLDVMMPDLDGFETCKLIKGNNDTMHIPVVMVTALSDVEDRIKGLEAGADEFLTKPVNDIELFARIKSLSRMKTVMDELKLRNSTDQDIGVDSAKNIIDENYEKSFVVLVDDDVVQSKSTVNHLSALTKNIKVCRDPDEVEKEVTDQADLVIVSGQLEGIDALRVIANLRAKPNFRQASFMLITDEGDMQVVVRAMEIGVHDYFHCPVEPNELIARAKIQLRRKKYQDALKTNLEQSVNLSVKDSLTGLYNRRYFDTHAANMLSKAEAEGKNIAAIVVDIDLFKSVNDTYGHQVGDVVIAGVGKIIQNSVRVSDLVVRYGGEEFVVIVSDVVSPDEVTIAERIRAGVERHTFNIDDKGNKFDLKKTASLGVAISQPGITLERLVGLADAELYKAKNGGRNRVCSYKWS